MYEFVTENNAAEFERFMSESKYGNFLQASIWAGVKKEWDSRRIISRDDNGNVRAAMLLLIRKVPHLPFSYLYAPRGPVCEPDEADGMMDLINAVREVAKQTNGYIFKCDPSFLADDERFKKSAEKCGLQLLPAGKNFDGVQPNFVFRLNIEGKTEDEIALEGIACLENFAKELGIPLSLRQLGATEDMLPKIAETSYEGGGYKYMTHEDILNVLKVCF